MAFVVNLLLFQQWKNFENPLRIDKVIAMSLVYYFLRHSVDKKLRCRKEARDASYLSVVNFVASIVQYLERSFFIISYFSFGFTSA